MKLAIEDCNEIMDVTMERYIKKIRTKIDNI